jgi:predicted AAA+ superfamily ATPase
MEEEKLLEILNDWNFWNKEINTGIRRDVYVNKLLQFLRSNVVVCITGVRRSGKSFILKQAARNLLSQKNANEILIVNFEDKRFGELDSNVLDKIFEAYVKHLNPKNKPIVFLDEIHKVPQWEKWVRTMHELDKCKIVVSGSTSELISKEYGELLTGRHLDINVLPLSFPEFLFFKGIEIKNMMDVINKKIEIKRAFDEFATYGGFPEVVLSENKIELLQTYFEDIILRDVVKRYKIVHTDKIFSLARFYLTNISSLTTFNSISQFLQISTDTVQEYSEYLENVFLIFFVRRFSSSLKKQEKAPRKVYSIDVGLSNAVGFRIGEKKGSILENIVAIELKRRGKEIYYWKNDEREVDFVVVSKGNIEQLLQVTYSMTDEKVKKREIDGLQKASKELNCNNLLVLTWDEEGEENGIKIIPVWKWLLNIE